MKYYSQNYTKPAAKRGGFSYIIDLLLLANREFVISQTTKHDIFFFVFIYNFKSHFFIHPYSIVCFLHSK